MKLKDIIQTAIFVCSVLMIPIFSFAHYLYIQTDLKIVEVLDKSFGVTAGLFGGAATLTAAYIASLLFNDWKVEHNTKIEYDYIRSILEIIRKNHITVNPIKERILEMFLYYQREDDPKIPIEIDLNNITDIESYIKNLNFLVNEYHLISKDDLTYLFYLKYSNYLKEFLELVIALKSIRRRYTLHEAQIKFLKSSKHITLPTGYKNSNITTTKQEIKMYRILEELEASYTDLIKHIADEKVKV